MRLSHLSLQNFRNYGDAAIEFGDGNVHLFVGHNGAGKTNILEAVSVLSLTKSCLNADDEEVVGWGREFFRVRGEGLCDDGAEITAEVVSQFAPKRGKACFLHDVKKGIGEMVGAIPSVVFLPQDLELFTGSPAQRRAYLDRLLSQVSPSYLETFLMYQKILKQRNALLRSIAQGVSKEEDLSVWDLRVAETGAVITMRRLELVGVLQCSLLQELRTLGESFDDGQIVYERKGEGRTTEELCAELIELLQMNRRRDIVLQSTSVGPHRDDWTIVADGHPLPSFASRGQQRAAVLALLMLQISYLELQRGERPIVLLDDVFSELDEEHEAALLKSFSSHQVFITATYVPPTLGDAALWHVEEGKVERGNQAIKVARRPRKAP